MIRKVLKVVGWTAAALVGLATAALNRHFEVGNLVLREVPSQSLAVALPDSWRKELSPSELSMRRVMTGEWVYASRIMQGLLREQAHLNDEALYERIMRYTGAPFFKAQASNNIYAEHYWRMAEIFSVPLARYPEASAEAERYASETMGKSFPPRSAYNPFGQMLIGAAAPDYSRYAYRVGDVEGVRRAALTAVMLREANVEAENVAEALKTAPLRNPYNDTPFAWSEQDRAIVFVGLEPTERGRHAFYY